MEFKGRYRQVYEDLKTKIKNGTIVMGSNAVPALSELAVSQTITNNVTTYTFELITASKPADNEPNKTLFKNDMFVVTDMGLYLTKEPVDATLQNISVPFTYPNPVEFPTDGTNFINSHLNTFFNGNLNYVVEQKMPINALSTRGFLQIPQTQKTTASNYDQKQENDGFIATDPLIIIHGETSAKFVLNVKANNSIKVQCTAVGFTHNILLRLKGFLLVGAARDTKY